MSIARAIARDSLRIDFARATPIAALVRTAPVVVLVAIGLGFHNPRSALTLGVGANLVAMVSLSGTSRVRISVLALDVVGLALATFVGSSTASNSALHLVVLMLWCFSAGMLVLFGISAATAGVQSVIAFVVFGRFVDDPVSALGLAGFVASGAAIEGLVVLFLHLPPTLGWQRARLAEAFRQLGSLALEPTSAASVGSAERLEVASEVLNTPTLFGRSDVRSLRFFVDEGRRIRLELIALRGIRRRLETQWPEAMEQGFDRSLAAVSSALMELATAIVRPASGITARGHVAMATEELAVLADRARGDKQALQVQCAEHLDALGGQLRSAGRLVVEAHRDDRPIERSRRRRRVAHTISGLLANLHLIRASLRLDSSAFRHAIRLALAVPGALLCAETLGLPRAYWVAFSVAVVLRPDYSSLFRRGLGRVIGTMLGATLAALVIGGLHPNQAIVVVLVGGTAWAGYSLWQANFPVAIGFITALVLCLLSTTQVDTLSTAADRLLDTVLGGLIALGVYVAWPTWSVRDAYGALASLIRAQGAYLDVMLARVEGISEPNMSLTALARAARLAWANAEAAIGRSLDEPAAHRLDPEIGSGVLAALRRVIESTHSLRLEAERGIVVVPLVSFEAFRDGVHDTFERTAAQLSAPGMHLPFELRSRFDATSRDLVRVKATPSIAIRLDEIVDAVNSVDALLAQRLSSA